MAAHVIRTTIRVYDRTAKTHVETPVAVVIDFHALAQQYAERAYNNKSKKAKYCHGLVTVTTKPV